MRRHRVRESFSFSSAEKSPRHAHVKPEAGSPSSLFLPKPWHLGGEVWEGEGEEQGNGGWWGDRCFQWEGKCWAQMRHNGKMKCQTCLAMGGRNALPCSAVSIIGQ